MDEKRVYELAFKEQWRVVSVVFDGVNDEYPMGPSMDLFIREVDKLNELRLKLKELCNGNRR